MCTSLARYFVTSGYAGYVNRAILVPLTSTWVATPRPFLSKTIEVLPSSQARVATLVNSGSFASRLPLLDRLMPYKALVNHTLWTRHSGMARVCQLTKTTTFYAQSVRIAPISGVFASYSWVSSPCAAVIIALPMLKTFRDGAQFASVGPSIYATHRRSCVGLVSQLQLRARDGSTGQS